MKPGREIKCDCSIEDIVAEHKKKPHWSNCIPFTHNIAFLECLKHHVAVAVEYNILKVVKEVGE